MEINTSDTSYNNEGNKIRSIVLVYINSIPYKRISNITTFILISFSALTVIVDINKFGYSGLWYLNHFIYVAFTYNIVIFAAFLAFLFIRYNYLALPIFLISYTIWDGLGVINGIITLGYTIKYNTILASIGDGWNRHIISELIPVYAGTLYPSYFIFNIPYPQFLLVAFASISLAIILRQRNILKFKLNTIATIILIIFFYETSPRTVIDQFIPDSVWATLVVLGFCYFSIKPIYRDSHGNAI